MFARTTEYVDGNNRNIEQPAAVSELGSGNEPKHLVGNLMIIDPLSAAKFIAVYKALLLEIDRTGQDRRRSNLIKRLVAARSRLSSEPSLIDRTFGRAEVQVRGCRP
jgi:hypothetical protein